MPKKSTNKDDYELYSSMRKEWARYHDHILTEFDKFIPEFKNLNYDKFYEYRDMYRSKNTHLST